MDHIELIDYYRGFNALLCVTNFVLLFARLVRVWKDFDLGQKLIFAFIEITIVVTVWRTFDIVTQDLQGNYFRLVLETVGLMILFAYLTEPRRKYRVRLGKDPLER